MSIVVESKWGIDLENRNMKYQPWPCDVEGKYFEPAEDEKDKIYGISGEAVRETLLYFEECDGDTDKLVELLNAHIIDNKYIINRDELLDSRRWYNNEYYFYFQMFCKKIIGRYDWRFGEGKNEQLSVYHKIWEKGFLDFIPFGNDNEVEVHDLTVNQIYPLIIYLEEDLNISSIELIFFLNFIIEKKYKIDRDLFSNETLWISGEFCLFCFEFLKIVSNMNDFIIISSLSKLTSVLRITKMFLNVSLKNAMSGMKFVSEKTNDIWNYFFSIKKNKMRLEIIQKESFDAKKFDIYFYSSRKDIEDINIGAFSSILMYVYKLKTIPEYEVKNKDNNKIIFDINFSWKEITDKSLIILSSSIIITFFISFGLFISKIINIVSFSIYFPVSTLAISAILVLIYKYKNLLSKYRIIETNSADQLSELEKITSQLYKERITLEEKVKLRTRELEKANEELKGLDKAKTNFFANVSHELRTPLTMIISPINDITNGKYGENIDRKNKIFSSIEKNALRLLRLINNILDFTKIEDGRFQINYRTVDIVNLLKVYLSQIESFAASKGINLKFNCSFEKLICSIDIDKLETAIFNLLSNAIKFCNPGGQVSVNLTSNDSELEISVIDNGIGIENVDKVFNRFYQESSELNRKYKGTGIGLALTKEIVDILGGRIICESVRGVGTSFSLILPLNRGETSEIEQNDIIEVREYQLADFDYQPKDSARSFNGKFKNILLLEDNDELSEYIAEKLSEFYNVEKASNGIKGLEKIAEYKPDIILSDIMMPEMDGVEFYREIRKIESYQNIPFIFVSARADDKERAEILKTGAMDYITKPINFNELFEKINNLLNIRDGIKNELKSRILSNIGELMDREDKRKPFDYDKILTDREKEIVKHIIDGKQNKEIAYILNLSERTIENHLSKIYVKFEVNNRIELYNKLK